MEQNENKTLTKTEFIASKNLQDSRSVIRYLNCFEYAKIPAETNFNKQNHNVSTDKNKTVFDLFFIRLKTQTAN